MNSYFRGRLLSVTHALRGLTALFRSEPNAKIHAFATLLAVLASVFFRISPVEWALVAFAITGVWVAEAMNTAIESVVDRVSSEIHPLSGRAKDVAAGGVLVAAVGSLIIAGLVFGPRILALCGL